MSSFVVNEKVLCVQGLLIYDAKCLKIKTIDNQNQYLIHYLNWKKRYDEWVPESRLLQYNEHNIRLQQELKAKYDPKNRSKIKDLCLGVKDGEKEVKLEEKEITIMEIKTESDRNESEMCVQSGNAIMADIYEHKQKEKKTETVPPFVETKEDFINRLEIRVIIPKVLKELLFNDWDLITRQKKVFVLPANTTVDQIIDNYLNWKLSTNMTAIKEKKVIEVVNGIKEYFNTMLGSYLLYSFERHQYLIHLLLDREMSSIYGFIHLLRLFSKMGTFLANTSLDSLSAQILLHHLHDFLKYLARNSSLFDTNEYVIA